MKRFCSLLVVLGFLFLSSCAKPPAFRLVSPGGDDASCTEQEVRNAANQRVELPEDIQTDLGCASLVNLTEGRYLFSSDVSNKVYRYDLVQKKKQVLFDIFSDIDGVSGPAISPNGKRLLFVVMNQEKKHAFTDIARLIVVEERKDSFILINTFDRPVNFDCESVCSSTAGSDFSFKNENTITYKRNKNISEAPGKMEDISLQKVPGNS